jgi:hypothetical protein
MCTKFGACITKWKIVSAICPTSDSLFQLTDTMIATLMPTMKKQVMLKKAIAVLG